MPYESMWNDPDLLEDDLQDNLGLREQDIRAIMENIQFLANKHWHYDAPGDGGFTENARSWHSPNFYNPVGWSW